MQQDLLPGWAQGGGAATRQDKADRRRMAARTFPDAARLAASHGLELRLCDAPTAAYQLRKPGGWRLNVWATTNRSACPPGFSRGAPQITGNHWDLVAVVREAVTRRRAPEPAPAPCDEPCPFEPNRG